MDEDHFCLVEFSLSLITLNKSLNQKRPGLVSTRCIFTKQSKKELNENDVQRKSLLKKSIYNVIKELKIF